MGANQKRRKAVVLAARAARNPKTQVARPRCAARGPGAQRCQRDPHEPGKGKGHPNHRAISGREWK